MERKVQTVCKESHILLYKNIHFQRKLNNSTLFLPLLKIIPKFIPRSPCSTHREKLVFCEQLLNNRENV